MDVVLCKWNEDTARRLRDAGYRVILVLDQFDREHSVIDPILVTQIIDVASFNSIEDLAAAAVTIRTAGYRVDNVLSHTEFSQYGAGLLGELLGLEGALERAVGFRDKRAMKERVRAAGVRTAKVASLPTAKDGPALTAATATVGFPLVLKPANGLGTAMTYRIDNQVALSARLATLGRGSEHALLNSDQMIIEEFIRGVEYHADAVWHDGQPTFFAVHRYFAPRLSIMDSNQVNLNGSVLLPESAHGELYAATRKLHDAVNKGLGIRNGITHMEFFVEDDTGDLVFSEIATRVAGGGIDQNVRVATGECLYGLWIAQALAREPLQPRLRPAPRPYVAWVNYSPTGSGKVAGVPSREELLALPGVLDVELVRDNGDDIDSSHPSNWCVILNIGGESVADVEALALRLGDTLRLGVT